MTAADRATLEAAARIRAWRNQLDTDTRAWFQRNGHPIPDPLHKPHDEVPGHYGYGTSLRADDLTELPLLLADLDAVLAATAGLEQLQKERGPLADEIETRYILDPADDEWDNAYNTAVRDVLRFVRGDLRPGLDLVRDAVRKARGGDAPPQIQGFA